MTKAKTERLFTDLEEQFGVVFEGDYKTVSKLTEEEALKLFTEGKCTGVTFEDRIKFLEDNGYEVTRENLVTDLSFNQPIEG